MKTHPKTGQAVDPKIRFQGQWEDLETGLYQNLHRFYDPHSGRYINHDPIGLMGGLNQYQYCPNPVGWVDPLGLSCKEVLDREPFILSKNVDAWKDTFGQPGEGLATRLNDLPKRDPMRTKWARTLKDMRANGVPIRQDSSLGPTIGVFGGDSLETGLWFRYQPDKMRSVDMLEEAVHWEQMQGAMYSKRVPFKWHSNNTRLTSSPTSMDSPLLLPPMWLWVPMKSKWPTARSS
ncbi:MAG: RHS repeat-associated core domain-containing protein [Reinekea sp.]